MACSNLNLLWKASWGGLWIMVCEAQTRHQRCRTRFQRGGTRLHSRDAAACTSGYVVPRGFHFFLADSHQHGSDSGWFAWNWAISADSGRNSKKKKKKKVQNTPFELNIKPYFSPLHTNTKLQLSTSPHTSVSHSSLCSVCSLPLCLCLVSPVAMRHSAKQPLSHSKHQSSALFQSCGLCLIYKHHVLVIIYCYS